MNESNLKLYSIGIVVRDKVPGSDEAIICPIESMSIQPSGSIAESSQTYTSTTKNIDNQGFSAEIASSNYLSAKWLPLADSNRTTAPDVYANETVIVFKFANVEEYYWTSLFREPSLRKQETVLSSYSNVKAFGSSYNLTTSYWSLFDTRGKQVKLHTSDNDGEHCKYDIEVNTKAGNVTIKDSKGNSIVLDSSSNSAVVTTVNSTTVNSPNITLNGNVTITGDLTVKGGMSSGGNVSAAGSVSVSGNVSAAGSVTGNPVIGCPCR